MEKVGDIRSYDMCPSPDQKMPLKEAENVRLEDFLGSATSAYVSYREGVKLSAYKMLNDDMILVEPNTKILDTVSKRFRNVGAKAFSKAGYI